MEKCKKEKKKTQEDLKRKCIRRKFANTHS